MTRTDNHDLLIKGEYYLHRIANVLSLNASFIVCRDFILL